MELLPVRSQWNRCYIYTRLLHFYEIVLSTFSGGKKKTNKQKKPCRPWLHIYLHLCHWTGSCDVQCTCKNTHTHTHTYEQTCLVIARAACASSLLSSEWQLSPSLSLQGVTALWERKKARREERREKGGWGSYLEGERGEEWRSREGVRFNRWIVDPEPRVGSKSPTCRL